MTEDELDQVRRLLLAFEDAAAWCEQLAELARAPSGDATIDSRAERQRQVALVIQNLAADRDSVARVRTRLGLPPLRSGSQPA